MVRRRLKSVHWHGDTRDIIRRFPKIVRRTLGSELYLLQLGERPLHSRPMAIVGRGVWEIRITDGRGAFRADLELGKARYLDLKHAD